MVAAGAPATPPAASSGVTERVPRGFGEIRPVPETDGGVSPGIRFGGGVLRRVSECRVGFPRFWVVAGGGKSSRAESFDQFD